jgi:hypothetical protein
VVAAAAVGKDDKGGGGHGVVVKKNSWSVFSILMFSREAVCPDGLFVPAIFRESGFYLNSLNLEEPIGYPAHTGLISLSVRPSVCPSVCDTYIPKHVDRGCTHKKLS